MYVGDAAAILSTLKLSSGSLSAPSASSAHDDAVFLAKSPAVTEIIDLTTISRSGPEAEQVDASLLAHAVSVDQALEQLRGDYGPRRSYKMVQTVVDVDESDWVLAGYLISLAYQLLAKRAPLEDGTDWWETESALRELSGALIALRCDVPRIHR